MHDFFCQSVKLIPNIFSLSKLINFHLLHKICDRNWISLASLEHNIKKGASTILLNRTPSHIDKKFIGYNTDGKLSGSALFTERHSEFYFELLKITRACHNSQVLKDFFHHMCRTPLNQLLQRNPKVLRIWALWKQEIIFETLKISISNLKFILARSWYILKFRYFSTG